MRLFMFRRRLLQMPVFFDLLRLVLLAAIQLAALMLFEIVLIAAFMQTSISLARPRFPGVGPFLDALVS